MVRQKHADGVSEILHDVPGVMEVVAVKWPASSRTEKFSYDKAHGFVHVLEGEAYVMYVMEENRTVRVPAGKNFTLEPETFYVIGSVYGAKTLHFNAPPATGATSFLQEEDDCLDDGD